MASGAVPSEADGAGVRLNLSEQELADILHCISETSVCERPALGLTEKLWTAFIQAGGVPEEFPAFAEEYGVLAQELT